MIQVHVFLPAGKGKLHIQELSTRGGHGNYSVLFTQGKQTVGKGTIEGFDRKDGYWALIKEALLFAPNGGEIDEAILLDLDTGGWRH